MSTAACFSVAGDSGFTPVGAGGGAVTTAGATGVLLAVVTTGGFFPATGAFVWEFAGEFKATCWVPGLDFENAGSNRARIMPAAAALAPP